MTYHIYTDGGARGNPGKSGAGIVCYSDGKMLFKKAVYLGHKTNNQAEYMALYIAAKAINDTGKGEVVFFLDSLLVVKQMLGEYKIKNLELKKIHTATWKELGDRKVSFEHVRREKNTEADAMANMAMNRGEVVGQSFTTSGA